MANRLSFPLVPRPIRQMLQPLDISSSGMSTQQRFLEVIAKNISNASTTRTPDGGPYKREVAVADGGGSIKIVEDQTPGQEVYDPGHPDANADGYVRYPNVDMNNELVDLMIARRVFEANASVFQAAKSMLRRALDI
ncbi:MAG TPA: flagellar basal body rod protein FlgC [Candidatus Sulfotelmatobacter sp.]|nr:flagellar basal body rod protein FlgC [Candidatus Sulfotelmatobacter sp.]